MDKWKGITLTLETILNSVDELRFMKVNPVIYFINPSEKWIMEEFGMKENEDFVVLNVVPPGQVARLQDGRRCDSPYFDVIDMKSPKNKTATMNRKQRREVLRKERLKEKWNRKNLKSATR